MLVVTNRCLNAEHIHDGVGGKDAFGEQVNENGPNELRLAHADKRGGSWRVRLVPEPTKITAATVPSRAEFLKLLKQTRDAGRHCLFFVHGFNKTFPETLEQGWRLKQRFGVELVLFSWPSSPGGFVVDEYRSARRIAQASFGAFDALLEKFARYQKELPFDKDALVACDSTVNLMTYSLGNYLFQNYVVSNEYADETRVFSNVLLCQADVDNAGHADWVERVVAAQRIYVTINENDKILGYSEAQNNYARLGRLAANLDSRNALYFDFTGGEGVGNTHQLWGEVENPVVKRFFKAVFHGERAEALAGYRYDQHVNVWRIGA